MTTQELVGKLAKRLSASSDVWFEIASAANLDLDRDVPIQGQRHLIQSWAGVAAGVRFAAKELQGRIVEIVEERDELRQKLTEAQQAIHELENEDRKHRVHDVFLQNKQSSVAEIELQVMQEVAS